MAGLTVIKFLYRSAKEIKQLEIKEEILNTYDELESTLKRPEHTDLGIARELIRVFRADSESWGLRFPILRGKLIKIIYPTKQEWGQLNEKVNYFPQSKILIFATVSARSVLK